VKALTDSAGAVRSRGINAFVTMGKHVLMEAHELQLQEQHGQGLSNGSNSSSSSSGGTIAVSAAGDKIQESTASLPWVTSVLLPAIGQLLTPASSSKERQTGLFMVAKASIMLLGGRPRAVPKSLGELLKLRHQRPDESTGKDAEDDDDDDDEDEEEYLSLPAASTHSDAPSAAATAAETAALAHVLPLLVQKGFCDSLPTVPMQKIWHTNQL